MRITLIAAADEAGVIGREGGLPWRLPGDLKRFKLRTMGQPLLMGRKTWLSIGRPLPGRRMIVVTRDADFSADGVEVAHGVEAALALARQSHQGFPEANEIMIGGGGEIYAQLLPAATRMLLTIVHHRIEGDTVFPRFSLDEWHLHTASATESSETTPAFTEYDLRKIGVRAEAVIPAALRRLL
ncbi:MAG: dihydrofolate reductase [Flavobacteriales bacterium]|jgi:dihydrofolate reductase